MKIIIAGGRDFSDYEYLLEQMNKFIIPITEIVSGTARGADRLGERYAKENDISLKKFPADWKEYGKAAGHIRNRQMADYTDTAVIFWNGKSRGSENMIETMKRLKKPVKVCLYE